jgi:hypothetical protein
VFAKLNFSRTGGFLVELLMLVLGINIALWFEGQFQEYQDAKAEEAYLVGSGVTSWRTPPPWSAWPT